MFMPSSA